MLFRSRLTEEVKRLTSRSWSISIEERLKLLTNKLRGWVNYFKIAKGVKRLQNLDGWIRRRLRMCIWKTWKKIRIRIANVVKLGMDKSHAYIYGNTRKSYWRIEGSQTLTSTLTNNHLANLGYVSMESIYRKCHV